MISLLNGNALSIPLADNSVQCVVTSPPYWGLRDYGVSNQIGLEATPALYVAAIVAVMRECWRVLKDDGTLWLNLGDTYATGTTAGRPAYSSNGVVGANRPEAQNSVNRIGTPEGLKTKDLCGIPWRVAFALQDAGWYLRSDIIWSKSNPMPESVTDRPTKSHEYVFLLTKQARYYYDAEAIAEPVSINSDFRQAPNHLTPYDIGAGKNNSKLGNGSRGDPSGRNRRSVWTVSTSPYSGAHFATFPPKLVEPMILAGSRRGDIVLDPFSGSGTVGAVCAKHGRNFVGVELNPKYIELAHDRTSNIQMELA